MDRARAPAALIFASFALAIMLTIIPLPTWLAPWRPEWAPLALIYWALALPRSVGVGLGWLLGLLVDASQDALLGEHALGFAIIAYITLRLHQRLRLFALHQQALFIALMLLPYKSVMLWINGIHGHAQESWLYWAPVLSSSVLWPCVFSLLHALRGRAAYLY